MSAQRPEVSVGRAGFLRRVMSGRDPNESNRASTPLELLFDLCFVVAVSQAATQLHHALTEGHLGAGIVGYAAVFFAIWWAWMNFSWFASAYDTDDVPYRLLTLLQMSGVLVLAAGVPGAFTDYDFTVVVIGYVIMRAAMIAQWLRCASEHPEGRSASLRYATGISIVQLGWVAQLWVPGVWQWIVFGLLVVAELSVPAWAEFRGRATRWHPGHIAERYSLFTIIVLGEVILSTLSAVQAALTEAGMSASVMLIAFGGLVLVFALWWIYFTGVDARLRSLKVALTWGYGHYFVLAAIAALGAGLDAAVDVAGHQGHTSEQAAALAVAVPVLLVLTVLAWLHRLTSTGSVGHPLLVLAGAVLVLVLAFSASLIGIGAAVLAMAAVVAATLASNLIVAARQSNSVEA